MNIGVTGEGPTDYGKADYGNPGKWIEGPIQVYLRRIAADNNAKLNLEVIDRAEIQKIKLQRRQLNGISGKAIPARKFYIKCKENKIDHGVYYCDADRAAGESNSNIHQLEKRHNEIYDEVKVGMYDDNNFIPAIPCRMIENWMLADENNIRELFLLNKIEYSVHNVESLWGKDNDQSSNYPKNIFERMKKASKNKDIKGLSNRELFCEIAETQNLEKVRENCRISFERFYDDYVKLLENSRI